MGDLPPGFRFYPTEEELVFYLINKLNGTRHDLDRVIPVVDIYEFNPWDLPQFVGELCRGDPEQWFFFIPRQEKEARGGRPNRLTTAGYWKATGCPGNVYSSQHRIIGMKRTMVFYRGRAPNGKKTEWKMNEYRAIQGEPPAASSSSSAPPTAPPQLREEFSLCRVYLKSKCLRAFDRRPPPELVMAARRESMAGQAPQHHHQAQGDDHSNIHQASSSHNHRAPLERTSSAGSSSSSSGNYHANDIPPQNLEDDNNNWELLLDWEDHHMDWV